MQFNLGGILLSYRICSAICNGASEIAYPYQIDIHVIKQIYHQIPDRQ